MGSLTKRPKTPTAQSFIRPATPVTTPSFIATNTSESSEASEADIRNEVRQESLLRRSRGRLGTVFTGFRGLLSEVNNSEAGSARKTLLGE